MSNVNLQAFRLPDLGLAGWKMVFQSGPKHTPWATSSYKLGYNSLINGPYKCVAVVKVELHNLTYNWIRGPLCRIPKS